MVSGFGSGWGSLGTDPAPGTVTAPTLDPGTIDLASPTGAPLGGLDPATASAPSGGCGCGGSPAGVLSPSGPSGGTGPGLVSPLTSATPVTATDMGAVLADGLDLVKRHWWWILLLLVVLRRKG